MDNQNTYIPIYNSKGDTEAYLVYPNLFNRSGEWIGFVTREREVYSVYGQYVGWLSDDPRILCTRSYPYDKPKKKSPQQPEKIRTPSLGPLAPMMPELGFDVLDVLQDDPDRLPSLDRGEFKQDLD
jgi:hypothetical protein